MAAVTFGRGVTTIQYVKSFSNNKNVLKTLKRGENKKTSKR